jgi:hypothetical protein
VENDIETLAIALYVKIDDMLKKWPDLAPARPEGSIPPTVSDAELLTMAVMSALLLGFTSERRWLRYVTKNLAGMFPRRIGQSGYNKRIRKARTRTARRFTPAPNSPPRIPRRSRYVPRQPSRGLPPCTRIGPGRRPSAAVA